MQLEEASSSVRKEDEERDTDPLLPDKGEDDDHDDHDQVPVIELAPSPVRIPSSDSAEIVNDDGEGSADDDSDPEAGSAPCCRICLECDGEDGKFELEFVCLLRKFAFLCSFSRIFVNLLIHIISLK